MSDEPKLSIPSMLITDTINESTVKELFKFNADALKEGAEQAIIYMDSFGGFCHAGTACANIMITSPVEYHVCNLAESASAALHILIHADVRWAAPTARFMFHQMHKWVPPSEPDQLKDWYELSKKEQKVLETEFAKRTKHDAKWWVSKAKSNENRMFWFNTKEAKKYGVIDQIGVPQVQVIPATAQIIKATK